MTERKRNTGSFLVPGMEEESAQARARKALTTGWLTARVIVVRFPDADEPLDESERRDSGFVEGLDLSYSAFAELPTLCCGWACPFPFSVCSCCTAAREEDNDC